MIFYVLSSYNKEYKIDLPVYLRFVEARRHDSVTDVVALAEFRELLPQYKISNYVLDSAMITIPHMNYAPNGTLIRLLI